MKTAKRPVGVASRREGKTRYRFAIDIAIANAAALRYRMIRDRS